MTVVELKHTDASGNLKKMSVTLKIFYTTRAMESPVTSFHTCPTNVVTLFKVKTRTIFFLTIDPIHMTIKCLKIKITHDHSLNITVMKCFSYVRHFNTHCVKCIFFTRPDKKIHRPCYFYGSQIEI